MPTLPTRLGIKFGPRLTFQFEGLQVVIDQSESGFEGIGYSRVRLEDQQTAVRYNYTHTPVIDGGFEEAKHSFAFDLWMDELQLLTFEAMVKNSDARFKTGGNGSILLLDNRIRYNEETPRSRAIVAGTTESTIIAGQTLYFAQFSIKIPETQDLLDSFVGTIIKETSVPGTFEQRTLHKVSFTALELDPIPA